MVKGIKNLYEEKYSGGYSPKLFEKTYELVLDLTRINKKDRILEIGCGKGHFLRKLMKHSKNVYGIDLNKDAIKNSGLKNCFVMDAQNMKFKANSFDKIFCIHTIEHLPDLEKAFSEMGRVLRKDGKIVLVYPFEPIRGLFEIGSSIRVYGHPFCGWKFHLHTLLPSKIEKISKKYNLKILKDSVVFVKVIGPPWPHFFTILEKV